VANRKVPACKCGLTPRSTGPAPAGGVRLVRSGFATVAHQPYAACLRGPVTSNVRQHSHTMRRTAAVVEGQAARSARAMRRQARSPNAGASFSPLKYRRIRELLLRGSVLLNNSTPSASRPSSLQRETVQWSQFFVPAAGSTSVPSVTRSTGGGRGHERGTSEEQRTCAARIPVLVKALAESGARRVLPNPSVKRSAAGRPPSPRAAVVYPASRGLGVLPPSPAYLER
jgi:hypothetical protein